MQTLEPLQTKYKQLISNEWSLKIAQRQTVRNEIASILIMFQGVATASKPDNSKIIFGYLSDVLSGSLILLVFL